jgi:hypothetical protein
VELTMRCASVLPRLHELACDDLPQHAAAAVQRHLAGCFACTRAYAEAVEARNALSILRLETGAGEDLRAAAMGIPGVDDRFFRVMREEVLAEVAALGEPSAPAPRRHVWFGSGLAVAATLLFAVGFLVGMFPWSGELWDRPPIGNDTSGVGRHDTYSGDLSKETPVSSEGGLRPADDTAIPIDVRTPIRNLFAPAHYLPQRNASDGPSPGSLPRPVLLPVPESRPRTREDARRDGDDDQKAWAVR